MDWILKKLTKKNVLIFVILIFIIFEIINIHTDIYNFWQLEKAKVILDKIPKDDYKFFTLKKLNEKYKADIHPIKNCYYVSNDNWDNQYIFGFKLESLLYRLKYLTIYYSYPSYDRPYSSACVSWPWGKCYDMAKERFTYTISNPCQD